MRLNLMLNYRRGITKLRDQVHCTIEHINGLEHLVVLLDPIYISEEMPRMIVK